MEKRAVLISCFLVLTLSLRSQQDIQKLLPTELAALNKALIEDTFFAQLVNRFGEPVQLYKEYKSNVKKSDSIWINDQKNLKILDNIGYTERFEMIPLIDWFTKDSSFIGEAGVSYLIRTDEATILFDVGLNPKNSHPSPLLHNMKQLRINLDEIDIIVISHNHGDHVGGGEWASKNTFSLTNNQIELGEKTVYTPTIMTYPGLHPIYSRKQIKTVMFPYSSTS